MLYVDGLVTALPVANKEAYKRLVQDAVPLMRTYGAINVVHCNEQESSRKLAVSDVEDSPSVVLFSWIIWPSREARDAGMERMLSDPRIDDVMNPVSLQGERLELDDTLFPRFH
ncbi:DUF1428 domain-containing protein [Grimontia sp. NTOU-MAR1]|uniref:DUF1428 domain-containing protein n=1 Tax=Grimontia sp. NTOU-MAR1 TaxID=3111011 RepID=UPI002DBC823E|nr:DUF1428 domain-containing protein [Grimontia sp. NTOU-MAR1]WRW00407.1 DUF1428 domain-containing protein [Grimontia sp. NTOU-MAR1]